VDEHLSAIVYDVHDEPNNSAQAFLRWYRAILDRPVHEKAFPRRLLDRALICEADHQRKSGDNVEPVKRSTNCTRMA
jgi:hypothetical protein